MSNIETNPNFLNYKYQNKKFRLWLFVRIGSYVLNISQFEF